MFEHHLHIHHHCSCEHKIDEVLHLLKELKMALSQDILDLSKKIDDATNVIAAKIAAQSAKIKNSMTDEEVAAVKTALQGEVDKLTALGQDPANPIPPTP